MKEPLETMSKAYVRFFILENTLRTFVKKKLKEEFGSRWIDNIWPIITKRRKKMFEEKRKTDPESLLYETYFSDLKEIITDNKLWETVFSKYFHHKERIITKLDELGELRNKIAHTKLIKPHNIKKIEAYYVDLLTEMKSETK